MRKSSLAFLKLSYRVYFLFLTAVRCFITLGMRVRDASHLDQVASFTWLISLLVERLLILPTEFSVSLVVSTLLVACFSFQGYPQLLKLVSFGARLGLLLTKSLISHIIFLILFFFFFAISLIDIFVDILWNTYLFSSKTIWLHILCASWHLKIFDNLFIFKLLSRVVFE